MDFGPMKPTVVVFAGAGTKGIFGYLGPIFTLEVMQWFDQVHTFAGTSIGSLFAFSMGLKIPSKTLMKLAWSLNLSGYLKDLSLTSFLQKGYGLDTAVLRPFLIEILHIKFPDRNDLTFNEFYELTGNHFICNAVEKSNNAKHIVFSTDLTPNQSILDSIEMSCALPLLFKPPKYFEKERGHEYIDGGLINNFLIDIFDDSKERILGIRFKKIIPVFSENSTPKDLINQIQLGSDDSFIQIFASMTNPFSSSIQVLKYLIWIFLVQNREMEHLRYSKVKFDQIEIDPMELTTVSVFISNREKLDIFYHSVSQTIAYLKNKL